MNKSVISNLIKCYNIANYFLENYPYIKNLFEIIEFYVAKFVKFNFATCEDLLLSKNFIILCIHNYFNGINKILAGKDCAGRKHSFYNYVVNYRINKCMSKIKNNSNISFI